MAGIVKSGRETIFLLHRTWSAFGTKRTSRCAQSMSAFGGKADIARTYSDVRFWPKADIGLAIVA